MKNIIFQFGDSYRKVGNKHKIENNLLNLGNLLQEIQNAFSFAVI